LPGRRLHLHEHEQGVWRHAEPAPLVEQEKRWEIEPAHPFLPGIDETMSIDQTKHSLFGASKVAADVLVQEYGRYFGMKTVCFRGGCLTGPGHAGTEMHGFLAYLMKCTATGMPTGSSATKENRCATISTATI
jgi:nucleoside-diphosphate-sugar epimerase